MLQCRGASGCRYAKSGARAGALPQATVPRRAEPRGAPGGSRPRTSLNWKGHNVRRYRTSFVLMLTLVGALLPLAALASYRDTPPAQPGFTHTPWRANDDTSAGLQLPGGPIFYSSPAVGDIDTSFGGREIVVGASDGLLYAYRHNGQPVPGWPKQVTTCGAYFAAPVDGLVNSSPAIGDLDGDGRLDVVVGYGTITIKDGFKCPGGVVAYNGNGGEKWRYALSGGVTGNEALRGVFSSPALADVDGDGKLEVGFGNYERDIVMLEENGALKWRYHVADTVWSSPAMADADGDGLPDLIIGTDIARGGSSPGDGGFVFAFRGRGTNVNPSTKRESSYLWRNFYNQTIWSSPTVADLNGDGAREVIVGSGCYDGDSSGDGARDQFPERNGHWIKILNIANGQEIRQLNAAGCVSSTPALADIDGNGKMDIVAGVKTFTNGNIGQPVGKVQAWAYDNPSPRWTTTPTWPPAGLTDPNLGNFKSPAIADIDGNGSLEILIGTQASVAVLNYNGAQLTCGNSSCGSRPTLQTWGPVGATPAVADLDNNGALEVIIGASHSMDPGRGYLYVWTNISGLGSPSGNTPRAAPWPSFRGVPTNAGAVPTLAVSPRSVALVVERGSGARSFGIRVSDPSGGAVGWSASSNQGWATLSSGSGSTPANLTLRVDPSGRSNGNYSATVQFSSPIGSAAVNVTMRVAGSVSDVWMPITRR